MQHDFAIAAGLFATYDFEGWARTRADAHTALSSILSGYDSTDHAGLARTWRLIADKIRDRDFYGLLGITEAHHLEDSYARTLLRAAATGNCDTGSWDPQRGVVHYAIKIPLKASQPYRS